MTGISATASILINATLDKKPQSGKGLSLGKSKITCDFNRVLKFTPGTSNVNQADISHGEVRTIAPNTTDALDLTGFLTNDIGNILNEREVVLIYVEASAENTREVIIGGAPSNTFKGPFNTNASKMNIRPGEFVLFSSAKGWTTTADTGDIFNVANPSLTDSATYQIIVVGRSVPAGQSVGLLPINTVLPVITGTATVGSNLNCSTGTWSNSPTVYSYQWKRNDVTINGANSSTYVFASADINAILTCVVTATNTIGASSAVTLGFTNVPASTYSVDAALSGAGTLTADATIPSVDGTLDFSADTQSGLLVLFEDI